jgi:hypothetical protein
MTSPKYAPYDNPLKPFSIGLTALDPDSWIEPDADLEFFLVEKDRLRREHFGQIFYAEDSSRPAQQECLDILVDHLLTRHAARYKRDGDILHFSGRALDLADQATLPLLKARSLVQDDLVILEKREGT